MPDPTDPPNPRKEAPIDTTETAPHTRTLAVMFTDVEGSTDLRSRLGDREANEILERQGDIVRAGIEAHGGIGTTFLGDGFLTAFPSAASAVTSAMQIQRDLHEHNRADPDRAVRIRIGIHIGEVAEAGDSLSGQAIHAASRVTNEAGGDVILVSADVRADTLAEIPEEPIAFVDRGLFWLKGFPDRWRLYEVPWHEGPLAPTYLSTGGLTRLVERESELADVRRSITAALRGEGSLVTLAGEAGLGKTRLTQEATAEAGARGMRTFVGHCAEMSGAQPYLPFVEILEEALVSASSPEMLRGALGDAAPEISRIVPGVRRVMPDAAQPLELPPDQARRFLWLSVEDFLRRASQAQPLLLILEDLHWADNGTVALLEHLAPRLPELPLLVVATYRDVEVGPDHPLSRTLTYLGRRRLVERITLRRLTDNGVGDMIASLADAEPPAGLVDAIFGESEGNPFFVEEVFLHLAETGRILDDRGGFRTDLRIDELDVPDTVRVVVGERLAKLTEETRSVLLAAAVVGRTFDRRVFAQVARDPEGTRAALDEAERARLLIPADSAATRLGFAHELIRQTLLVESSSTLRQELHARVAVALADVYADSLEDHAAEIAYHLSNAGPDIEPAERVRYLRLAAEGAARAAAFEDAVRHLELAVSLLPDRDDGERAEVLEALAMALRSVGRWDDAIATMDGALTLYEQLGQTESVGRLCWSMVYHLGWAARFEEAVTIAMRGLAILGEAPNPDRARLASATGWVLGLGGDHASATSMLDGARALAEGLGDERALADVLHMEVVHDLSYPQFEDGVASGSRAAAVYEANGDLWNLASVLAFAGFEAGTVPLLDVAEALSDRAGEVADRLGHLGATFMVLADRTRRRGVMAGDLGTVEKYSLQMIEVCEQAGLPWLYVGHLYMGMAAHWEGRWEDAERELRTALELEPPAVFAGQSASLLALHLVTDGRPDEALEVLERTRPLFAQPGRVNSLGAWNTMFGFVEVLWLAGRDEQAAAYASLIDEALAVGEWITFDCRLVHTRAGIAAAAAHRWDESERHLTTALEIAEALPHRIEAADIRRLQARMLLRRDGGGDRSRARELLRAAGRDYEMIGMRRHRELTDSMLASGGAG